MYKRIRYIHETRTLTFFGGVQPTSFYRRTQYKNCFIIDIWITKTVLEANALALRDKTQSCSNILVDEP